MAEQTNYANLVVTEEDHAEIDASVAELMEMMRCRMPFDEQLDSDIVDRNPARPTEVIARFPQNGFDAEYVAGLFAKACVAQKAWRELPHRARIAIMRKFAGNVEAQLHRFIATMMMETGKPRAEAKAEACESVDLIRYYCNLYEAADGYNAPMKTSSGAQYNKVLARPLGVFAVISPFNFPLALATGMCAGALLTGNAVVWKPSSECPLMSALLHELFVDACMSANLASVGRDVFGFVVCTDGAFERGMDQSRPLIAGLAFTGSKNAGLHLKRLFDSCEPAVKIIGEFGGKNHCIVTANAHSLERMARGVVNGAFGFSGQKCSACSELVVPKAMERDAIAAIIAATGARFVMGDPRERDVTLGPLINARAYGLYQDVCRIAQELGCAVVVPNIRKKQYEPAGYYAEPVIISGLPADHRWHQEELFIPALFVRTYEGGIREAVEIANSTRYGLTAGLFSDYGGDVDYFLEHMEAGVLYVNREAGATTGAWPGEQAFGGWKNSAATRSQFPVCGLDYLHNFFCSQSHTVYA